jgi:hypothetical protein
MTLSTTRITITPQEFRLLSPGLEILANGLAAAKVGRFPNRHPWDRIDTVGSDIYLDRVYDEGMGERIVTTRAKLIGMTATRKIRVDVFQISVAAMALRLGKPKLDTQLPVRLTKHTSLVRKLEKYRKRARRAAVADLGTIEFAKTAESWRRFNQWVRYHLLQFTFRNISRSVHVLKARDQRQAVGQ